MKKKLFLFLAVVAMVACICAISVSADTLVPSDSNEYGELSVVDGVPVPTVIDKNAKSVVVVSGTYYTIPTYYLIADNSEFTWGVNSAVVSALGLPSNSSVRNNVVRIEIPEGIITSYESSYGDKKFEGSSSLIEASLPTSLELMGEFFFDECKLLTTVKGLENTKITKIYGNSFYSTSSLKCEIKLPSTVEEIAFNAFRGSAITSIDIPDAVTTIGDHAFAACSNLISVNFTENSQLTTLTGSYHFEKTGLTSFYFPSGLTSLGTEGMFFSSSSLATIQNLENTQITVFPYRSFEGCPITSLTLPAGTTYIGKNAFKSNNIQQDTLVIPNGVTTLYECSFAGKRQTINRIVLPANLASFGGTYCFEYLYAREYFVPAGLTAFGDCTFNGLTTKGVVFYFTGTKAQAEALKAATTATKNDAFVNATIASLEEYANATDKANKNYIVYGYNSCDAFYGGHMEGGEETGAWLGDKFLSNYQITCPCGRNCGVVTVVKELEPLFTTKGYSTSGTAMMQAFAINKSLWESEYSVLFPELKYGMVAAFNGVNPEAGFDTTSGKIVNTDCTGINNKVAVCDMTERGFDIFEIKISGVGADNYKETSFFLCAYIVLDGQVYYINNGTTSDSATGVSYSDVADIVYPDYGFITTGKEE